MCSILKIFKPNNQVKKHGSYQILDNLRLYTYFGNKV
jgi:hypothetical protein